MSYYDIYRKYKDLNAQSFFHLAADNIIPHSLQELLSYEAGNNLESLAESAQRITLSNFGKAIQLYTPLYLSNYCDNQCLYCGFSVKNNIPRVKLSLDEVEKEAKLIASSGLRHILILTGESRRESPLSYIKDCLSILKKHFDSIAIEIYPLSQEEYIELIREGADGLTIYQEVYDEDTYARLHPAGPKSDYCYRLDAPERGAAAGMRSVNIGVLLGLGEWRREVFLMAMHAQYLQDKFPDVEVGVSLPRIRPQVADFKAQNPVNDRDFVQIILALRIFLPRCSITLSTRESQQLRDNLIPLGITRMSAGSSTAVGARISADAGIDQVCQFEISDARSVEEIKLALNKKGYQGVLKDWVRI